jgi:antitoxin (DNA-binding transcriptional repressor) of toxin-antitoxin stability system
MAGLTQKLKMKYTVEELEKFLGELMTAAWSREEVIITRDGMAIAQLIHRGPDFKLRRAARLAGAISYKKSTPIRSRELADLGFEE